MYESLYFMFSEDDLLKQIGQLVSDNDRCKETVSKFELNLKEANNYGSLQKEKNNRLRKMLADTRKNNQILKSQSQKYRNDNVDQIILQKEIEQFKEELEAERQKNLKLESKIQNLNRANQPESKVLNCEQTAVCDIIINNPLREAFRIIIHPMAEVRFIESIRNGTHVNIDSIQPSSIWISPRSQRNQVSFLCLPGGIGHIQHISVSNAQDNMVLVDHQVVYGREYTLNFQSNLYFLIQKY